MLGKKINKTGKKVGCVQGSHVHLFNIVPDFLFKFMHFILYILKLQAGAQSAIEIRVKTQLYKRFVPPSLAILLQISSFGLHVVMICQTFPHKLLCFICLFGPLGFSLILVLSKSGFPLGILHNSSMVSWSCSGSPDHLTFLFVPFSYWFIYTSQSDAWPCEK